MGIMSREWRFARSIILTHTSPLANVSIGIRSTKHLHVVIPEVTSVTAALARQVALYAHYPNFNDESGENCTIVTFVTNRVKEAHTELEVYLGNLYKYCREENKAHFLDISIRVLSQIPEEEDNEIRVIFDKEEIDRAWSEFKDIVVDYTWAKRINMIYSLGIDLENLPKDNPTNISSYNQAMRVFITATNTPGEVDMNWPSREKDQLSNLFCADNNYQRLFCLLDDGIFMKPINLTLEQTICQLIAQKNTRELMQRYLENEEYLQTLSQCEHARWNVTELVLGFAPMTFAEHFHANQLRSVSAREQYYRSLKKREQSPSHVCICSNHDLARLKPQDRKYDTFLVLGVFHLLASK